MTRCGGDECTNIQISTHTLTWSVTYLLDAMNYLMFISTHTLTWSVTRGTSNFKEDDLKISTHTLTWSVTAFPDENEDDEDDFNSHAHVERDQ